MKESIHKLRDGRAVTLREAMAGDAASLLEYVEGVCAESNFLSMMPGEFALTVKEEAEFVEKMCAAENCLYLVAVLEGRLVGTMHFEARDRQRVRHAGEFGMSVRREFWGLGLGALLLDALIAWARDSGVVTKINLRVRSDNARAIRLYEGRGFETEGTIRRDFVVEGEYFDHHIMGLCL